MTRFLQDSRTGRLVWLLVTIGAVWLPICSTAQGVRLGLRTGGSFANFYGKSIYASSQDVVRPVNGINFTPTAGGSGFTTTTGYQYTDRNDSRYIPNVGGWANDTRIGFQATLFVSIPISKRWSIEPGIGYVQKGMSYTDSHVDSGTDQYGFSFIDHSTFHSETHVNYIVVPIVFKYTLDRKNRFYVVIGEYDAIAIHGTTKISDSFSRWSSNIMDPTGGYGSILERRNNAKPIDSGVTFGGGVQWPLGSRVSLGADLRENVGLIALDGAASSVQVLKGTRNMNIEASARLTYALRK